MVLRQRNEQQQNRTQNDAKEEPLLVVEEEASIESAVEKQWPHAEYIPPPLVAQSVVVGVGVAIFVLALLWPPLILLVTYIASKLIPYSFRKNDCPTARRQLFQRLDAELLSVPSHVQLNESYWTNGRGMVLGSVIMRPKHRRTKAVVCFCHGYLDSFSFVKRNEFMRLLKNGIAVCALEYQGHGKSDGALGLVPDWELLVDDVTRYFQETCVQQFPTIPAFLVGESMGGAVAYSVYNRIPHLIRGVVLVCPMCKIHPHMLPPQWVIRLLLWLIGPTGTSSWLGYLPIAPSNNLKDVCAKDPEKRLYSARCPSVFDRNPRLATARELIHVTQRISASLSSFDAPMLILHGLADVVTDPTLSQALYREAPSTDKSIRLYEGMWHSLLAGEPEGNTKRVFGDIGQWILERS